MQYEIYLDIIIFNQFFLNVCILLLVSCMRGIRGNFLRIPVAALVSALCGCILFAPIPFGYLLKSAISVMLSLLFLGGIGFPVQSFKNFAKNCLGILLATMLLGGISTFTYKRIPLMNNTFINLSVMSLLTVTACLIIQRIRRKNRSMYPVTLYFGADSIISTIALADTGNRLSDETGKGICVISSQLCPPNFKTEKVIAFEVLGHATSSMKGGVLERMVIHTQEGKLVYEEVPVAVCPGSISRGGKFEMILQSNYYMRE